MTAMDTIWKSAFQIIIPDIVMPEVCGSDIPKDSVEDREPRMVLLISGFGQEQHLIQACYSGMVWKYMLKPISPYHKGEVLEDAMQHLISNYH